MWFNWSFFLMKNCSGIRPLDRYPAGSGSRRVNKFIFFSLTKVTSVVFCYLRKACI